MIGLDYFGTVTDMFLIWCMMFDWYAEAQILILLLITDTETMVRSGMVHVPSVPYSVPQICAPDSPGPLPCFFGAGVFACFALRPLQTKYRERADRYSGQHHFMRNFVMTGSVTWCGPEERGCEDILTPPIQLDSTNADQITASLMLSFERFLFGNMSFQTWLGIAAEKFSHINFFVIADSASANIKLSWKLLSFLQEQGRRNNTIVTAAFAPCLLHQLSRMVAANLEKQKVSAAIYSLSRLNQFGPTRSKTREALITLLSERFVFRRGPIPPGTERSSPEFRHRLLQLLTGHWDFEEPSTVKHEALTTLFSFFNGDLAKETQWFHYCQGCCASKQDAINKVPFGSN